MKTYSLKSKLLKITSIPLIFCIILIGALGFISAKKEINEVYDSQLITSTNVLWYLSQDEIEDYDQKTLEKDIDITDSKLSAKDKQAFNEYAQRRLFRLWKNGKMFIYSDNSIPASYPAFKAGFSDFKFEGEKWKVYSLHIPEQNVTVEVAEKYEARYELISNIALDLIIPFLISLPLMLYLLARALTFGLQDVKKVTMEVESRSSNDLSPLVLQQIPSDLIPLTNAIDRLLEKIKTTLKHEREFIDNAAHSLKTPLAALKIQSQLITRVSDKAERDEVLKDLLKGVDRSSRLVNQLLLSSRIENSKFDLNKISLSNILANSVRLSEAIAAERSVKIDLHDISKEIFIDANEELLSILFTNILDNAVKFSPTGGKVDVKLSIENKKVMIEISDQGPGIKNEDKDKIFERFYQYSGKSGNGLGLPISRQIAELLGGSIDIRNSDTAKGLSVIIIFPLG